MYKVVKRDCPMFGIGPYLCEFICDTASDISTLPTSISEGTGGKSVYDNQKCASGSIANVAENGAESKQYILNNQNIWCPYSVATASSSDSVLEEAKAYTDSEIADLINGAPTTRDTLKEIADAMAENQTVVEALDAAIGTKANKTDIPTKVSELENDSGYLTEHQDLSEYAKKTEIPTELPADGGNADTLDGLHANEIATNPNLLINPDFRVNQQGKSEYIGTTECWDKWTVNEGWYTVRSSDDKAAIFTCRTPQINSWVVNQNIPNYKDYRGQTVTFSAYVITGSPKFKLMINDGVDQKAIPMATGRNSVTYRVSDSATTLYCVIVTDGQEDENEQIAVISTKLEFGTIATTFVPPNPSIEIAKVRAVNDAYASKDLYSDTTINVGRKAGTTVGEKSTAEGNDVTASGYSSHAEGMSTTASGTSSHSEGRNTTASGNSSHAEGFKTTASYANSHAEGGNTTASNIASHAEGSYTTASGSFSHAEGSYTTASNIASHAEGYYTTASNYASHASGKFNATMIDGGENNNTTGTAFVIGNGTSASALSNAFSVQYDGTVKAQSTITASTTADYAEFFEWLDENPDGEDRVGYFVTLDGDKIRIANSNDEYILGVVSGEPFVLGNGDCDTWNGMFLRDEFRRTIYEPAPKMEEILDDDGNPTGEYVEVEGEYEGTRPKLNPDYDHTKKYTSRFERKEWAPIGMLGVLAVRHDGTAKVNGYVTIADGGIATTCEKHTTNSYRVIKSNTDTVVEIIFR